MRIEDGFWPPITWWEAATALDRGDAPSPEGLSYCMKNMDRLGPPPEAVANYIADIILKRAPVKNGVGRKRRNSYEVDLEFLDKRLLLEVQFVSLSLKHTVSSELISVVAKIHKRSEKWSQSQYKLLDNHVKYRIRLIREFLKSTEKGVTSDDAIDAIAALHHIDCSQVTRLICHSLSRPRCVNGAADLLLLDNNVKEQLGL